MYIDPFGKEHRYGPPAGWAPPAFERFDAGEDWARLVERGLQFEPYHGSTRLCFTRGDCLKPLLIAGEHWLRIRQVAPDEPLIDGGLYIFECPWKDADNPDEIKAYCDKMGVPVTEKVTVMKFLRFAAYEWYYLCNQGIGSLTKCGGIVLSMVVAVIPLAGCATEAQARAAVCGNPFDAESVSCDTAQIGLNAATVTTINNNAGGGTGITGFTGLSSLGFVVNPPSPASASTVIVTATISARQTVGTVGQMKLLLRFADDSVTFVSASNEVPIASAAYQAYTLQWQFSHVTANAGHGQAGIYVDNTGVSTNSMDWTQATLQVEYIIR
jgi:hypothetical protein